MISVSYTHLYEGACRLLGKVINEEARRLGFLEESEKLEEREKVIFRELLKPDMREDVLAYSISCLLYTSRCV